MACIIDRAARPALAVFGFAAVFACCAHSAQAAAITVTTTTDEYGSGVNCSLREAIRSANDNANFGSCAGAGGYGSDVILLPVGTYVLDITGASDDTNATGDLDIDSAVTISATGSTPTIRGVGGFGDRLIHVLAGGSLNVKKVTIGIAAIGGSSAGGCVRVESAAAMSLDLSTVSNCSANGSAGGILNIGTLYLTRTSVLTNTADGPTGGGGIFNDNGATLVISGSLIQGNQTTAELADGGGLYCDSASKTTIINSTIQGNTSTSGGGIACTGATLVLSRTTVRLNNGQLTGGIDLSNNGMNAVIEDSLIAQNNAIKTRDTGTVVVIAGGGIDFCCGTLTITHSIVRDNVARNDRVENNNVRGGGLALAGTAVIRDSTISGNSVSGGVGDDELSGGGINALTGGVGRLTLINTTISDNSAEGMGGGMFLDPEFDVSLFNTTVLLNAGEDGGGVRIMTGGVVTLTNSVIAANVDTGSNNRDDCFGAVKLVSFSHVQNTTGCSFVSGLPTTGSSGLSASLANNGGSVAGDPDNAEVPRTHRQVAGSILIDAGDPSGCKGPTGATLNADQRDVDRPSSADAGPARCDIGAVELHYPPFSITKVASRVAISPATAANSVAYTITLLNTGPFNTAEFVLTDTLHAVMQWDSYPGFCVESVYNRLVCTLAINTLPANFRVFTGTASFVGALASGACGTDFVNNAAASARGFDGSSALSMRATSASTEYLCLQRVFVPSARRGATSDW